MDCSCGNAATHTSHPLTGKPAVLCRDCSERIVRLETQKIDRVARESHRAKAANKKRGW